MKKIIGIVLVLAMLLGMAGCSKSENAEDLATIKDVTINSKQLDEYVALLGYLQGVDVSQMPAETIEPIRGQLLGNMVQMEALKLKYEGTDALPPTAAEDVKKFVDDSKKQEGIKEFLDKNKISDKTLEDFFYSQFYTEAFYNEVEKSIPDLEKQAKKYYEDNIELYKEEQVRASHILFAKEDKAKAEKILKDIQNGANFEEMAAEYGTDGTKTTGGDLGFFGKGRMVPAFEEAAFGLKKGELGSLVETDFGWHIVKVTDKRNILPYDEVVQQIKDQITNPVYTEKMNSLLAELDVKYLTKLKPSENTETPE